MAVDVTDVLAVLLARNRGPDPLNPDALKQPDYGVVATLDGNSLVVELTFRTGAAYCCPEWGCHLALTDGKRWDVLRNTLSEQAVVTPARLELRLLCVVEEGAVFFNPIRPDLTRRNWYAFDPAAADNYEASATEAVSPHESELL